MINRKQKVQEMLEGFRALRRGMAFHAGTSGTSPRITPSQWGVLMMIGRKETAVKDVAKALSISSSAATQLIDGLVNSGYLVRKEHEGDRRKVTLALSPKSKKRLQIMRNEATKRFLKLFEVLNDKEFEEYMRLNKKISAKFLKQ